MQPEPMETAQAQQWSSSAEPSAPTLRNPGLAQQAVDSDRVRFEVQLVTDAKTSSELNLAVAIFSGPGCTGKTSTILAIQGKSLSVERESTHGGDGVALVVRVKKEELLGFERPRGDLSHLQRALLKRLQKEKNNDTVPHESENAVGINLSCFVSGLDSHDNIAEIQEQLEAMGGGLAATMIDEPQQAPTPPGSLPHGGGGPSTSLSATMATTSSSRGNRHAAKDGKTRPLHANEATADSPAPVAPEQIQVKREAAIVMRAQQEAAGNENQDGVHTLVFDLGGQPEFWPLVGEFLRK